MEAFVGGHYLQGGVGELATTGFATVSVMEDDLEEAKKVVDLYLAEGSTESMAGHVVKPQTT